jgi:predicted aspartyl protease
MRKHLTTYSPPIPALDITLQTPDEERSLGPLVAILDTGADITMVPLKLLEKIKAPELDEVRVRSHWGDYNTFTTYMVSIKFGNEVLSGVEVVGDLYSSNEAILGRDVLNKLLLLIDGREERTDILTSRPRISRL